jgi:hypothetical protein
MTQPDFQPTTQYVILPLLGPSFWGIKSMSPIRTVPMNLSEMALYPGFAQMEAKDGYYAPVIMKPERHSNFPIPVGIALLDDDPQGGQVDTANPIVCWSSSLTGFTPITVPPSTVVNSSNRSCPILNATDSNVVMFTGLSDATTLTLRVRWICERFPSDAEKEILVIATPTASFDPMALEIYSKMVALLPSGVPFTENPGGEWWARSLATLAEIVGPMVAMIPHPIAKVAGLALTGGGVALAKYADKKNDSRTLKNNTDYYGQNNRKNYQGEVTNRRTGTVIPRNPGPKPPKKRSNSLR